MVQDATDADHDAFSSSSTSRGWEPGEFYIAGLLLLASVLVLRKLTKKQSAQRLPPGPKAWPIIGDLHQLASAETVLPHHALTTLGRKYGPLMFLKMGQIRTIVVSSPDMAREVLKTQDQVFASRPKAVIAEVFNYNQQGIIWAPVGERHRLMRKACMMELFSADRLAGYKDIRREEVVNSVKSMLAASLEGKLIDVEQTVSPLFYNNITRMMFGKSFYGADPNSDVSDLEQARKFQGIIASAVNVGLFMIGEYIPWLRWMDLGGSEAMLKRLSQEFDGFLVDIIEEHRRRGKNKTARQDFVDVLLGLQNDENLALTDTRIKAILQDLLLAGVDTGVTHVVWTLTELMRHPEQLRKLQAEIDAVVGKDRLAEESDLVHLKYLQAVIKESFRLHPVTPLLVPHESIRATTIAGYDIPDKTRVFVNVYAIGRDPQTWVNPLEFNPDRFRTRSIDLRGQSFELTPFGSGRRICVGLNLAVLFVEYALATWIHGFEFALPAGVEPNDVDVQEDSGINTSKKNPLKLRVQPRLSDQVYEVLDPI